MAVSASSSQHQQGGDGVGGHQAWGEQAGGERARARVVAVRHAHINWTGANGTREPVALSARAEVSARAVRQPDFAATPPASRRFGTYEREREERGLILHYLRAATASQHAGAGAGSGGNDVTAAGDSESGGARAGEHAADVPTGRAAPAVASPEEGTTAAALLLSMRERPWEGRATAGSAREWSEWLEQLEPTLERHLRWLAVDGLAAQASGDRPRSDGWGETEVRFSAILSTVDERSEAVGGGGQASAGRQAGRSTGGSAVAAAAAPAAGGVGGPAGAGGGRSCVLNGQMRIMKSRPIKMVKPWR